MNTLQKRLRGRTARPQDETSSNSLNTSANGLSPKRGRWPARTSLHKFGKLAAFVALLAIIGCWGYLTPDLRARLAGQHGGGGRSAASLAGRGGH